MLPSTACHIIKGLSRQENKSKGIWLSFKYAPQELLFWSFNFLCGSVGRCACGDQWRCLGLETLPHDWISIFLAWPQGLGFVMQERSLTKDSCLPFVFSVLRACTSLSTQLPVWIPILCNHDPKWTSFLSEITQSVNHGSKSTPEPTWMKLRWCRWWTKANFWNIVHSNRWDILPEKVKMNVMSEDKGMW